MNLELKLRKVGNSLKVHEGQALTLTQAQDGLRLTASNPEFAKTMATFESLNRRYRNALRELAK
jgi:hypothetical protein